MFLHNIFTPHAPGRITVDRDGSFKLPLNLPNRGYYNLTVRAIDATGETHDFEHGFMVSPYLSLSVELENATPGEFFFLSVHDLSFLMK